MDGYVVRDIVVRPVTRTRRPIAGVGAYIPDEFDIFTTFVRDGDANEAQNTNNSEGDHNRPNSPKPFENSVDGEPNLVRVRRNLADVCWLRNRYAVHNGGTKKKQARVSLPPSLTATAALSSSDTTAHLPTSPTRQVGHGRCEDSRSRLSGVIGWLPIPWKNREEHQHPSHTEYFDKAFDVVQGGDVDDVRAMMKRWRISEEDAEWDGTPNDSLHPNALTYHPTFSSLSVSASCRLVNAFLMYLARSPTKDVSCHPALWTLLTAVDAEMKQANPSRQEELFAVPKHLPKKFGAKDLANFHATLTGVVSGSSTAGITSTDSSPRTYVDAEATDFMLRAVKQHQKKGEKLRVVPGRRTSSGRSSPPPLSKAVNGLRDFCVSMPFKPESVSQGVGASSVISIAYQTADMIEDCVELLSSIVLDPPTSTASGTVSRGDTTGLFKIAYEAGLALYVHTSRMRQASMEVADAFSQLANNDEWPFGFNSFLSAPSLAQTAKAGSQSSVEALPSATAQGSAVPRSVAATLNHLCTAMHATAAAQQFEIHPHMLHTLSNVALLGPAAIHSLGCYAESRAGDREVLKKLLEEIKLIVARGRGTQQENKVLLDMQFFVGHLMQTYSVDRELMHDELSALLADLGERVHDAWMMTVQQQDELWSEAVNQWVAIDDVLFQQAIGDDGSMNWDDDNHYKAMAFEHTRRTKVPATASSFPEPVSPVVTGGVESPKIPVEHQRPSSPQHHKDGWMRSLVSKVTGRRSRKPEMDAEGGARNGGKKSRKARPNPPTVAPATTAASGGTRDGQDMDRLGNHRVYNDSFSPTEECIHFYDTMLDRISTRATARSGVGQRYSRETTTTTNATTLCKHDGGFMAADPNPGFRSRTATESSPGRAYRRLVHSDEDDDDFPCAEINVGEDGEVEL